MQTPMLFLHVNINTDHGKMLRCTKWHFQQASAQFPQIYANIEQAHTMVCDDEYNVALRSYSSCHSLSHNPNMADFHRLHPYNNNNSITIILLLSVWVNLFWPIHLFFFCRHMEIV